MPKLLHTVLITALLTSSAAFAADTDMSGATARSPKAVLDHHVANMKSGDLEAVLSDYAPDAVVVTSPSMVTANGVFVGKDTRKLFSVLTSKDSLPGNKTMESKFEPLSADTTLMHWVQFKGTPKEVSGYDIFVIRGGKVVFQTVVVNPAKK